MVVVAEVVVAEVVVTTTKVVGRRILIITQGVISVVRLDILRHPVP